MNVDRFTLPSSRPFSEGAGRRLEGASRWWSGLSRRQRGVIIGAGAVAAVATAGGLAYAVIGAESIVLMVGPLTLATNKAAELLVRRRL